MKAVVVSLVVAALLVPASPAQAKPRNAKPRIQITEVAPVGPGPEGTTEYRIVVEAVDPDGIVSEVALEFGDGAIVWLLLACGAPGETAVQELNWSYPPGKYKLRSWAYSTSDCYAGQVQETRVGRKHLRVA